MKHIGHVRREPCSALSPIKFPVRIDLSRAVFTPEAMTVLDSELSQKGMAGFVGTGRNLYGST